LWTSDFVEIVLIALWLECADPIFRPVSLATPKNPMNLPALARYTIPILLIFALLDKYFLGTTYIFSPSRLQEISQASIAKYGNDTDALMKDIVTSLHAEYGAAVLPYEGNGWVLNNAGGAMVRPWGLW
jgi:ERG2 and Sigma1 receptor like protein